MSEKQIKQWLTIARESTLTNQNVGLVYMFPLSGRIKLSVTGVSENGRKKQFPLAIKKFPLACICQKMDEKNQEKISK